MCGIFFSISTKQHITPAPGLLDLLQQRGPDSTRESRRTLVSDQDGSSEVLHLTFVSTVLALRGTAVVEQPYETSANGSVLCWNGEAWLLADQTPDGNDTAQVFESLESRASHADTHDVDFYVSRLATIAGPFAIVYFDAISNTVYFGRDFLGRRSLLWCINADGDLMLSSVSVPDNAIVWHEVEADGLYSIKLSDLHTKDAKIRLTMEDWHIVRHVIPTIDMSHNGPSISVIPHLIRPACAETDQDLVLDEASPSVAQLDEHLRRALSVRITNIPQPLLITWPDQSARQSRLAVLFSGGVDCTLLARLAHDILPLDHSIDLLNVAFQNPRIHKVSGTSPSPYELCPDRITGRASFDELRSVCPGRTWRFVAIDVPYSETIAHRDKVIALMNPHNTEMDLSISCALYFASRGAGLANVSGVDEAYQYTTPARVLLSGLGADELFAGYTRHATAFRRGGRQGLLDELALDVGRLGKRNLGRDDRVISHWGKEVRFPYLDEGLVQWALSRPIEELCGFHEPATIVDGSRTHQSRCLEPGKKVLRCLAWKLKMIRVASEKKRAIQFGARTAKMETGKTRGTTLIT